MPAPSDLVVRGVLLLAAGAATMVLAVFPWRVDSTGGLVYESVVQVCAYALVVLLVFGAGGNWCDDDGRHTCQHAFALLVFVCIVAITVFFLVFVLVAAFAVTDDDGRPVLWRPVGENPAWYAVVLAIGFGVTGVRRLCRREHHTATVSTVDKPVAGLVV